MTRMNIFNATAVVPTLARIVLCAAFLTMGWNKLMNTQQFTGDAAATLIELGVVEASSPSAAITPAAWRIDDTEAPPSAPDSPIALPAPEPAPEPAPDAETDAETEDDDTSVIDEVTEQVPASLPEVQLPDLPQPPADVLHEDPQTGERVVEAKRMHGVTVAVANGGWAQPVAMAWVATLTELIGGTLLLLGLFSRVWGLGLAIAMGVAFYFTSYAPLLEAGPFSVAADMQGGYAAFHRMFAQLGLGVLGLGVFLTGPGPLSLDRLLFRPNHPKDPEFDDLP